jgi:hypothetical protein
MILSFIFNKKYLNKMDRTMFYFVYENPLIRNIDKTSILNVAYHFTSEAEQIMREFNQTFSNLKELCNLSES